MNNSRSNPNASALVRLDNRASLNDGWAHFHQLNEWVEATDQNSVVTCLEHVEARVEAGLFAVGYVAFEAAAALDQALACSSPVTSRQASKDARSLPLAGFALFEKAEAARPPFPHNGGKALDHWTIEEGESVEHYRAAIEEILDGIAAGDVYQVNYTFPLLISLQQRLRRLSRDEQQASSLGLFERLCRAQGGAYACFLRAGDLEICSASPELFFEVLGEKITTQPMKGTAPRGRFLEEDWAIAESLRESEKDRAENLMIVDMMRNDLGRIAQVGSVTVPSLFEIQKLPTLHQMTSTVQACTDASLASIFAALFPCSSITGAPKSTAMKAIRQLESQARGIYTGAVGVVLPAPPEELGLLEEPSPPDRAADNPPPAPSGASGQTAARYARFNVAIRTAWRIHPAAPFHYGVGSGIVWDSQPDLEYQECRSKALAITQQPLEFRLLETMLLRAAPYRRTSREHSSSDGTSNSLDRIWLLRLHTARLQASAEYFAFHFDTKRLRHKLLQALSALSPHRRYRLRVLLDPTGALEIQHFPEPRQARRVLQVAFATDPVHASDPFLFHKTTHRTVYQEALDAARKKHGGGDLSPGGTLGGAPTSATGYATASTTDFALDDVILHNQDGELTESCFANLIVNPVAAGEAWRTPPRSSGLLAGTLRQALFERGRIVECPLYKKDVLEASSPLLINSVRGLLPFEIIG